MTQMQVLTLNLLVTQALRLEVINKIFQDHVKYNLRKYFFSNRVIQTWNSLPDFVVASGTTNSFKNNLDKFWFNEEVKYN